MRERWAKLVALLTGGVVLALAVFFAYSQNRPDRTQPTPAPPPAASNSDAPQVEAGRRVYTEQGCALCHSIAGQGSPRSPLDGVGTRLSADEISRWITPSRHPAASKNFQARHAQNTLTDSQRAALLTYLRSLRSGAP
jgi:mono/diheme cytochrome c family protein